MFSNLKVICSHGKQYIEDLDNVQLPGDFRGRPEIEDGMPEPVARGIEAACPTGAFRAGPVSIDLGRCTFCGECARRSEGYVKFTKDYRMGTNVRENLIITAAPPREIRFDPAAGRAVIC